MMILLPAILALLPSCQVLPSSQDSDASPLRDSSPHFVTTLSGTISLDEALPEPASPVSVTTSFALSSAQDMATFPANSLGGELYLGITASFSQDAAFPQEFTLGTSTNDASDGYVIGIVDVDHSETLSSGDLYGFTPIAEASFEELYSEYQLAGIEVVIDRVVPVAAM